MRHLNATRRAIPLAALLLLPGFGAVRHNRLVRAEPGVDSTIAVAPAVVRLWFKEDAEVAVSSIKLAKADGTAIAMGTAIATDDPKSIAAPVEGKIGPGGYTVTWKTSSRDGHVIRGSYRFTLK